MPRKPRLNIPGGLYHVILRGNGGQTIFYDDSDRFRWESYLQDGLRRYRHRVHAYCWMTNHIHLALQSHAQPLSQFMSLVASRYAKSTNRKMTRSGHVFERRHRAILVQTDNYLKELIRYIHYNPVRAGIVRDPVDYAWSSHEAYLGGAPPDWLTMGWVLSHFGGTEKRALHSYRRFMKQDQSEAVISLLRAGSEDDSRVLGDDGFMDCLSKEPGNSAVLPTLDELIRQVCVKYQVSESEMASGSRSHHHSRIQAEIAILSLDNGIASVTEIARRFGRSQSSLSRAASRLRSSGQKAIKLPPALLRSAG